MKTTNVLLNAFYAVFKKKAPTTTNLLKASNEYYYFICTNVKKDFVCRVLKSSIGITWTRFSMFMKDCEWELITIEAYEMIVKKATYCSFTFYTPNRFLKYAYRGVGNEVRDVDCFAPDLDNPPPSTTGTYLLEGGERVLGSSDLPTTITPEMLCGYTEHQKNVAFAIGDDDDFDTNLEKLADSIRNNDPFSKTNYSPPMTTAWLKRITPSYYGLSGCKVEYHRVHSELDVSFYTSLSRLHDAGYKPITETEYNSNCHKSDNPRRKNG